jgi:DNA-binding transcriptional regulator YdaS (Cro superfamily)
MSYKTVIAHFGTPSALAAALAPYGEKITPQAIYKWRDAGVPRDRAPLIEDASGGRLRAEDICPSVEWERDKGGNLTGYRVPVVRLKRAS